MGGMLGITVVGSDSPAGRGRGRERQGMVWQTRSGHWQAARGRDFSVSIYIAKNCEEPCGRKGVTIQ